MTSLAIIPINCDVSGCVFKEVQDYWGRSNRGVINFKVSLQLLNYHRGGVQSSSIQVCTSLPTDATLGHGFLTYSKKSYPSSIYTRRHCPHAGGSWSAEGAQWWGETLSQGPRSSPRWVSSTPLHLLQWDLSFSLICFYGSLRYA